MKQLLTSFALAFSLSGWSQTDVRPPLTVTGVIRNEITGKPVDAVLGWPDRAKVRHFRPG